MRKKYNIAIIGDGRIGQAVAYYLKKEPFVRKVSFAYNKNILGSCDLLIGALPGRFGKNCLKWALACKKDLIDISDVDAVDYLPYKKDISKKGITVIAGCGFSPGLVNFILGRELSCREKIKRIEIKSGSLSRRKFYYPFLWCFEDIVLEHCIPSWQIVGGKRKKFPPFSRYRKERISGIEAESYLAASGFENILLKKKIKEFTNRVIRPYGFMHFFKFLESYGFLKKHMQTTKKILEAEKEDNITVSEIAVSYGKEGARWLLKSYAQKKEALNSMQKITASVAVSMAGIMLGEDRPAIEKCGLLFMEDLGADKEIFNMLIKRLDKYGIIIKRRKERL
jgi:saccharopine dehydrogenase-like NADP-dependent oxidoreductase